MQLTVAHKNAVQAAVQRIHEAFIMLNTVSAFIQAKRSAIADSVLDDEVGDTKRMNMEFQIQSIDEFVVQTKKNLRSLGIALDVSIGDHDDNEDAI
jgi:hypothetical protein